MFSPQRVKLYIYPVSHGRQRDGFLTPRLSIAVLYLWSRKAEKINPYELFPAPRGEGETPGQV
jgi:hypothetical protein